MCAVDVEYAAKCIAIPTAVILSPVEEGIHVWSNCSRLGSSFGQEAGLNLRNSRGRRNVRGGYGLSEKLRHVDLGEETMAHDVFHSIDQVAEPLRQVAPKQVLNETLQLAIKSIGVTRFCVDDLLVDVHYVVVHEGCVASVHLVD